MFCASECSVLVCPTTDRTIYWWVNKIVVAFGVSTWWPVWGYISTSSARLQTFSQQWPIRRIVSRVIQSGCLLRENGARYVFYLTKHYPPPLPTAHRILILTPLFSLFWTSKELATFNFKSHVQPLLISNLFTFFPSGRPRFSLDQPVRPPTRHHPE